MMPSIKPLDVKHLERIGTDYHQIFVVEEHSIIGGLGSAIAEFYAEREYNIKVCRMGFQDCYYKPGSSRYIWRQAGICDDQIAETINKRMN